MNLRTLSLAGLVILAATGLVVVLAYSTVWQMALFSLLPCLSSLVGLILALAGLIVWLRTRTTESPGLSRVKTGLFLAGVFLLLQAAYFPLAQALRDREVERAQTFINTLIPKLEAYEQSHNEYPASPASVLTGDEAVPWLLQLNGDLPLAYDNRQYYQQRDTTYSFQFYVPDGFAGFQYEYCCGVDGVWTVTD